MTTENENEENMTQQTLMNEFQKVTNAIVYLRKEGEDTTSLRSFAEIMLKTYETVALRG